MKILLDAVVALSAVLLENAPDSFRVFLHTPDDDTTAHHTLDAETVWRRGVLAAMHAALGDDVTAGAAGGRAAVAEAAADAAATALKNPPLFRRDDTGMHHCVCTV